MRRHAQDAAGQLDVAIDAGTRTLHARACGIADLARKRAVANFERNVGAFRCRHANGRGSQQRDCLPMLPIEHAGTDVQGREIHAVDEFLWR